MADKTKEELEQREAELIEQRKAQQVRNLDARLLNDREFSALEDSLRSGRKQFDTQDILESAVARQAGNAA